MSNGFSATESREVSLYGNDYKSIEKFDALNIYKYLMTKNIIKSFLALLNKRLFLLYYWVLVAL